MTDAADKLIEQAVALRTKALTAEQRERRERVRKRNEAIQRGVPQPKSGSFGKPSPKP